MGWYISVAMYLYTTRRTQEGMEISALPQECNERIVGRLKEASIAAVIAMDDTRYIIFCIPIFDRCHIRI